MLLIENTCTFQQNLSVEIKPIGGTLVDGSGPCPVVDCNVNMWNVCPPQSLSTLETVYIPEFSLFEFSLFSEGAWLHSLFWNVASAPRVTELRAWVSSEVNSTDSETEEAIAGCHGFGFWLVAVATRGSDGAPHQKPKEASRIPPPPPLSLFPPSSRLRPPPGRRRTNAPRHRSHRTLQVVKLHNNLWLIISN